MVGVRPQRRRSLRDSAADRTHPAVSNARSVCHAGEHADVANAMCRSPMRPLTEALGPPRTITRHWTRGIQRSLAW